MDKYLTIDNVSATYEAVYRASQSKEVEKVFINGIIKNSLINTGHKLDVEGDMKNVYRLQGARAVLNEIMDLFNSAYDMAMQLRAPKPDRGVY